MGYPHYSVDCQEHHSLVLDGGPLVETSQELKRQDEKWGVQNHPSGTGGRLGEALAHTLREFCEQQHKDGVGTWADILAEEVGEAFGELEGDGRLRAELIQVAAVCLNWVSSIDRRSVPAG
jgi:hypothetical protein